MSQLPADRDIHSVPGAPPPKWTPEMTETPAQRAIRQAAEHAEEMRRYLPIEDDEMPA